MGAVRRRRDYHGLDRIRHGLAVCALRCGVDGRGAASVLSGQAPGRTDDAVGAITGAVVILGRRALVDWLTLLIACAVLFALLKVKKIPEPLLIFGAALVGLVRGA